MKKFLFPLVILFVNVAFSQVKVGDDINTIDQASILELESVTKVFVVTRVSTIQMNAITPLNGALVFNTDENCLYQYRTNIWTSLCVDVAGGETVTAIVDNNNGTFTYTNESGLAIVLSKSNFTNNGDGTYTFTNGSLTNITLDTNASALPYTNATSSLTATDVQSAIDELATATDDDITGVTFDGTDLTVDEGTTTFSADLSALEESADIAAVQADVDQNEADADNAIAAVQADVNQNETDADNAIAANATAIAAHNTADGDLSDTNELSDLSITGTTINLTNPEASATGVDLDTTFATDAELAAAADDDITGVSFDGTDLTVDEGTTTFSADLSALEESADITALQADVDKNETDADNAIAAVQTDVDQNETDADNAIAANATAIAAHNTADGDLSATNELSDVALTGTTINLTNPEASATGVDLDTTFATDAELAAAADDDITGVSFDGTDLTVDEGTTTFSADLSALEESADIAAVQADVDQNETDADNAIAANATAITAHNTADGDLSATNELSDVALSGTVLNLTNPEASATGVDLDTTFATDAELAAAADDDITGVSFDGTDLTVDEGTTTFSADLSALEESADIAAVQADVDQNETDADNAIAAVQADVDQNETDADNAIAAVQADVDQNETDADNAIAAVQADVDQNETDADNAIAALQADVDKNETDADNAIAAVQTDVDQNEVDADNAIAANATAIAAHNTADGDLSDTNELSDVALSGTVLNLTNPEASATGVDLDTTFATDAELAAAANDDITGVSFDGTDLTVDEGTTSFSADLSALEESADITALQADVDQNETDADNAIAAVQADVDQNETDADNAIAAVQADVDQNEVDADNAIAAVQADVDQNETDADNAIAAVQADVDQNETDADNGIAANATAIAAHNTADGDLSDTNELSDVALSGTVLNLTNPEVGATGVDLDTTFATDAELAAAADDDITGVSFDGTDLTVDEGTTTFSADLSALEESADIAAVQADVDQNETDADAAIVAVQADVDQNETDADNAIAAVQADVDQNETDADNAIAANATAIAAHNTADGDLSDTNELSDVALSGTVLNLTNPEASATGVDLDTTFATDAELAAAADDDITGVSFDGTDLTVDEGTTTFSADLSALEESADIAALQADVDQNETDADAAIVAVQADVDQNETDADNGIAANATAIAAHNTADGDLSDTNELSDVALSGTVLNLTNPEASATGVDLDTTFATDAELAAAADDDITGVSFDGTDLTVDEGTTSFSADLSALEESADIAAVQADVDQNETDADAAIVAAQADVDQNETDADNAIAAVQADVDQNETDADNAIAANATAIAAHNTADGDLSDTNELSDVALSGTVLNLTNPEASATGVDLDTTFATDAELAAAADDDITGVSFDGTDLTVDEGTTTFSADLSALEESADIAALQADVDQNETDADAAIVAVQADVDQNETDADNAIATNATAIAAHNTADGDLSDSNELSDVALSGTVLNLTNPEASATGVDLDTTFATDAELAAAADDDITGVSFDGTDLTVDEGTTSFSADLSALEESADIAAVQADVDQNEADADNAIAANATAIAAHNTADGDLSDTNELSDLSITGNTLTLTNPATGTNSVTIPLVSGTQGSVFFADTDGTATENNNQLFWDNTNNRLGIGTNSPTHKLQVVGQVRATSFANANGTAGSPSYRFNNDGNTGMFLATTDQLAFSTGGSEAMRIDNLGNIGIGTSSPDEGLHVANNMRLDGSFEDKDGDTGTVGQILTSTATGTDWTNAPGETITTLAQNTTTGAITFTNETPTVQTANVIGAETNNSISVGANGGSFYESPIKAFGKISAAGGITRATNGISVTKLTGNGHYRVNLPATAVSDANYIIQLSQPGRGGSGNDDPGISYSNQTATSFEVIIGDNDNGGTDRSRFDSEFMFTILDL